MVERIEAMPLVVKPADMGAVSIRPGFPQGYNNPVCLAIRVRPSHDGPHAGGDGLASVYIVPVHAFTGASTSPLSMRLSAPWA